jgi:hypothetical protein
VALREWYGSRVSWRRIIVIGSQVVFPDMVTYEQAELEPEGYLAAIVAV